jgi:hypothetical protein
MLFGYQSLTHTTPAIRSTGGFTALALAFSALLVAPTNQSSRLAIEMTVCECRPTVSAGAQQLRPGNLDDYPFAKPLEGTWRQHYMANFVAPWLGLTRRTAASRSSDSDSSAWPGRIGYRAISVARCVFYGRNTKSASRNGKCGGVVYRKSIDSSVCGLKVLAKVLNDCN